MHEKFILIMGFIIICHHILPHIFIIPLTMNTRQENHGRRANFQTSIPYDHNGRHGLSIAQVGTISGKCSPIHIAGKIRKLCDYLAAINSKFIC